jgi:hypothetical protein
MNENLLQQVRLNPPAQWPERELEPHGPKTGECLRDSNIFVDP